MSDRSEATELEQLIRDLNDSRNQAAPDRIDAIQRQIQRLQRRPSAWQIGLDFLDHSQALIRFYGALTLTIKVNTDWEIDNVARDRNLISQLIERLTTSYVRLSMLPDEAYVLSKLCGTLVAVFQKNDSAWAYPVRHILACILAGHYVPQEDVPDMDILLSAAATISEFQLQSMLLLATILAEEAGSLAHSSKSHNAEIRMSNNAPDIWKVIRLTIQSLTTSGPLDSSQSHTKLVVSIGPDHQLKIALTTIGIVPFWANFVHDNSSKADSGTEVVIDCFKTCMAALILFFGQSELSFLVIQAFTALEQNHHRLLIQVLPDYAMSIINSQTGLSWLNQLLGGDFDIEATGYVEFLEALLNQADVTTPSYLENQTLVQALNQMRQLLRCDGVAGIDDTVCQIALEMLTSVAEGFGDWEEPTQYDEEVRSLIRQACRDCLAKLEMPPSELDFSTQTWDTDDRARFQDFRYDVRDYLQNAFAVLGVELLEEITNGIVDAGHDMNWPRFEANIFGLVAFSDTMNSDAEKLDQFLGIVLSCEKWRLASQPSDGLERVRQVMIKLVGENTSFLERHEDSVITTLNFLFDSLRLKASATSASRAIFTLCDAQRTMLVGALPQFLTSLETVSDLESDARSRLFGGVSAIVEALPTEEEKMEPLYRILTILGKEKTALLESKLEDAEVRTRAVDLVWTLATIGKGLRAPSDAPVELDDPTISTESFWLDGPGKPIQQLALDTYDSLRRLVDGDLDSLFVEATCDFLKSAYTESLPSPFKFSATLNHEVLGRLIKVDGPQPDNVLATASSYLASIKSTGQSDDFTVLFSFVLQQCQNALASREADQNLDTEFCAAALEFLGRALQKWVQVWLKLPEFEQSAQVMVELGLVLMQDSDTLPRRAAAAFVTALFEASGNSKVTMNQGNAAQMASLMQGYGPRILAVILHLLGGECARSELENLTEPLKRFVQKQPMLANKLIKEAFKEENHVLSQRAVQATKPEQRDRFASQIIMLKGARKTNEIVREFWIACKGSSFGYVV